MGNKFRYLIYDEIPNYYDTKGKNQRNIITLPDHHAHNTSVEARESFFLKY